MLLDNQIKDIILQNQEALENYPAKLLIKKQSQDLSKEDLSSYLSDYELKFFDNITNTKKKQDYLQGRLVAKEVLTKLTGIKNHKEFTIKNGIFGQPVVHSSFTSNIQISLSHSSKYAAALAFYEECPMAIDIEEINLEKEDSVKSQMTQHEISSLMPQINVNHRALCLWTAKESLAKILRTGLHIDFKLLEVKEIKQNDKIIEGKFTNFSQYKFISFLDDDYICSLAFPEKLNLIILK